MTTEDNMTKTMRLNYDDIDDGDLRLSTMYYRNNRNNGGEK